MDWNGVWRFPEGSPRQGRMERYCSNIICGAPTTSGVKGLRWEIHLKWCYIFKILRDCTLYLRPQWVAKDPSFLHADSHDSWSDWADAQANLSLRWARSHFVGFVMKRLISFLGCNDWDTHLRSFHCFSACHATCICDMWMALKSLTVHTFNSVTVHTFNSVIIHNPKGLYFTLRCVLWLWHSLEVFSLFSCMPHL